MKVVIVDDSEADRYLARRVIRRACPGAEIVEYAAGYLALEDLTDEEAFDAKFGPPPEPLIVLVDINMPRIDGFQLAEAVRESPRAGSIHVFMYSSSDRPSDRVRAESNDVVRGFVTKPLTAERFRELATR